MRTILLLTLCAAFAAPSFGAAAPAARQKPVIAGYLFTNGAALEPGQIDARGLTRINYAFAGIKDGRIVEGSPQDAHNLELLTSLRRQNPGLTVLISVGGWRGSKDFSDVALTRQSRQVFIQSALAFIERYHLDGLDLDWEYPGERGAGNTFRGEDKQNFTLLLEELRERFNEASAQLHRPLYLTIAAAASQEYLQHTEMNKVQSYVDAVNLMAYDFYVPGQEPATGNSAPLFTSPADPGQVSADKSVQAFEQAGVPAAKIVLGMPFYGYAWSGVPASNHGLFQPGKPAPEPEVPYIIIERLMLGHGFRRYWDSASSVPYLYDRKQHTFVSYEDAESVAAKCQYVQSRGLAGVMFWKYSDDPEGTLLRVMDRSLGTSAPADQQGR